MEDWFSSKEVTKLGKKPFSYRFSKSITNNKSTLSFQAGFSEYPLVVVLTADFNMQTSPPSSPPTRAPFVYDPNNFLTTDTLSDSVYESYKSLAQTFHDYLFPYTVSIDDLLDNDLYWMVNVEIGKCRTILFNDNITYGCNYVVCQDGCPITLEKNYVCDPNRGCILTEDPWDGSGITIKECCQQCADKEDSQCNQLLFNPPVVPHSLICNEGPRPPEISSIP